MGKPRKEPPGLGWVQLREGRKPGWVRKELGIAHDAGIYACIRGRINHTAGFEFRRPTESAEPCEQEE